MIGTILSVFFLIMLHKGSKYEYMVETLSGDDFPMKTIYIVGLVVQDTKIGRLKGKLGDQLRKNATLLYTRQYSEYYARIMWAQIISFVLLFLSFFFVLAGFFTGTVSNFFALVGICMAVISACFFATYAKNKVKSRQNECESEFPNAISKLALLVNSGVILHEAWKVVAYGKDGIFYDLMKQSCEKMQNGQSDIEAIYEFGMTTNSDDIKKFTSALIQSIERGGAELPRFLENQSGELWFRYRQVMLQKGEQAAGALLMPISLMFFGVILIVISAAMQSLSL